MQYITLPLIAKDLAGRQFGRLTVLGAVSRRPMMWHCKCSCGGESISEARVLVNGSTRSCGCLSKEYNALGLLGASVRKHGLSQTPLYAVWQQMIRRCTSPSAHNFARYGGRGVKVCDRWHHFENFLADMGERPEGCSIERIDNNGNYEPDNCRWATCKEQSSNMRVNRKLTFNGETLHLTEWARRLNMRPTTLRGRLQSGWSVPDALSTPTIITGIAHKNR